MKKRVREFRLIPVAMIAIGALLVLKTAGLIADGGYTLGQRLSRGESIVVTTVPASTAIQLRSETVPLDVAAAPPIGTRAWAQDMFNYPDVTGSVAASKPAETKPDPKADPKTAAAKPPDAKPPETTPAAQPPVNTPKPVSAAERAVLERLQERRQQLDARARELDIRESLLKAAEQKLEKPATDTKNPQPDVATPQKDEPDVARFKSLVTMYENMKPKDAAKIFDRLDIKILVEVSGQINPRAMSAILAQMSPEAAERLTVELANRARTPGQPQLPAELPKIDGKPIGG